MKELVVNFFHEETSRNPFGEEDEMFGMFNDLQALIDHKHEMEEGLENEMQMNIVVDIEKETTNIFKDLLNEARSELYPRCSEYSSLNFLVKMMHVKVLKGWSYKSFYKVKRKSRDLRTLLLFNLHYQLYIYHFVSW